jgi:hypothetical protein
MKKTKVIKAANLPARLPIFQTVVVSLALDYYDAPPWLRGAVWALMLLWWIACGVMIFAIEEPTDLLNEIEYETKRRLNIHG